MPIFFAHSSIWLLLSCVPLSVMMAFSASYLDMRQCHRNLMILGGRNGSQRLDLDPLGELVDEDHTY